MAEKESKMRKVDSSNLEEFEVGTGIDVTEFEGQKIELEGYDIVEIPSIFDPETNEKSTSGKAEYKVQKVRVFSKPVAVVKNAKGEDVQIRATELFGMHYDSESGKFGVTLHEKSALNKFLAKCNLPLGLEGLKQIGVEGKGKQKLVMKIVKKGENDFLGLSYQ